MHSRFTTHTGFTIVELLIVIVVIAVLAAISVVAYSGIQRRAYNTQLISVVKVYRDALVNFSILERGTTHVYPRHESGMDAGVCLGEGYENGRCWIGNSGNYSVNATFDNLMKEFISSKPTIDPPKYYAVTASDNRQGAVYIRGNGQNGNDSRIEYLLDGGGQSCGMAEAEVNPNYLGGTVTRCILFLPGPRSNSSV